MKALVLYDKYSTFTNTVYDHLEAFSLHSKYAHAYCHIEDISQEDLARFSVIVIHYSVRVAFSDLTPPVTSFLSAFNGLKVLFVQDEYDLTENTRKAIKILGISVVFSCVPSKYHELIYPSARFPEVRFVETLTGYLTEVQTSALCLIPIKDRQIIVGYRGRELPYWYGDLGQEKKQIAVRMRHECQQADLKCDIEWSERKRIYGKRWPQFLEKCKATLGTESGCNIFDDNGEIRRHVKEILARKSNISYEDVRYQIFGTKAELPIMNQISPRIFEAISHGTSLVLYEGRYSGILCPGIHYISLKKDYSNIQEVIDQLKDDDFLQRLVENCYYDILKGGKYSYRKFISKYDEILEDEIRKSVYINCSTAIFGSAEEKSCLSEKPLRTFSTPTRSFLSYLWAKIPLSCRNSLRPLAKQIFQLTTRQND